MYSENSIIKLIFMIFDALVILFSFLLLNFLMVSMPDITYIGLIIFVSLLCSIIFNFYSNVHRRNTLEDIPYIFMLVMIVVSTQAILQIFYIKYHYVHINIKILLYQVLFIISLVFVIRSFFRRIFKPLQRSSNVIVLTTFENYNELEKFLNKNHFNVVAYMSNNRHEGISKPVLNSIADVRYLISHYEINAVYITSNAKKEFLDVQEYFAILGIPIIINVTSIGENNFLKSDFKTIGEDKVITYSLNHERFRLLLIKRFMDIIISFLGIILTFIIAIMIYPIVQKQSKGPLLFKQKRVGKNGKIFEIYKFRSMYLDAEERKEELMAINTINSDHMFKMDNDPRIFPFGQKIRDWSLDELPQFINVLRGDMSVVGTRPPTVDEYKKYELHHFKRLGMKPGITGMWQVSGRSNITDFEKVVELDTYYIKNWSLWLDIKIIFRTFKVVLKREGSK